MFRKKKIRPKGSSPPSQGATAPPAPPPAAQPSRAPQQVRQPRQPRRAPRAVKSAVKKSPWASQRRTYGSSKPFRPLSSAEAKYRDAMRQFDQRLLPHITAMHPENSVHSAFSAFKVLALTMTGAAGPTCTEMASTLCLDHVKSGTPGWQDKLLGGIQGWTSRLNCPQVSFADALFLNHKYKLMDNFKKRALERFDAKCEEVGFPQPGLDILNGYVSEKTHGMIPKLLSAADPSTLLCLVNVVYFKAKWSKQFKKENTKKEYPFRLLGEKRAAGVPPAHGGGGGRGRGTHLIDMMSLRGSSQLFGTFDIGGSKFEACSLKYKACDYQMVFMKPIGGTADAPMVPSVAEFNAFLKVLQTEDTLMRDVKRGMRMRKLTQLMIPKFTLESDTLMTGMLKAMGMPAAFDEDLADFTAMLDPTAGAFAGCSPDEVKIYITMVLQKAKMQVDEEGTVAVAATVVSMGRGGGAPRRVKTYHFVLDSPFVCCILHAKSNTVLFTGVVRKPIFKKIC